MRNGNILASLLLILAFVATSSVLLTELIGSLKQSVVLNTNKVLLEVDCNNCMEFSIATVKMGIDNLCALRSDIFKFDDHGVRIQRELEDFAWSSKTAEFIRNWVDRSSATIIFSSERTTSRAGLHESDFRALGLEDAFREFQNYVSSANLDKVFCAVYKVRGGGRYLILSKVRRGNRETGQVSVITSERLNKFIYYSEQEDVIYFTSREVIYGPLKSNDYIHTYQYSWTPGSSPTFLGTVEVRGVKHYDERTRTETVFDSNNPHGVSNVLSLRGNPPIRFVGSDVAFSVLYRDYNAAVSRLAVSLDEFIRTNFNSPTSKPLGITLPATAVIESKVVNNINTLRITLQGNQVYELSWQLGSLPNATFRYLDGGGWIDKPVKFNGLIISDMDITLEDLGASLQNKFFVYDGNLTIFSRSNLWINTRILSKKVYDYLAERGLLNVQISSTVLQQLIDYVVSNEASSLDLVANARVFLRSNGTDYERIDNQKIMANIYAFGGSFGVENHRMGRENGQLFVFGSIMQKRRGPVGLVGQWAPGYSKFYVHDPRALMGKMGSLATPAKKQSVTVLYLEGGVSSN